MVLTFVETLPSIYFGIAVFFSVFYVLQSVLAIFGNVSESSSDVDEDFDLDEDFDVDEDFDIDEDIDEDFNINYRESGQTIHFLSVRSIISFFILFGWTGYLIGPETDWYLTLFYALIAGLVALVVVSYVVFLLKKLAYDGTAQKKDSIGTIGEVYLKIPVRGFGSGKVQLIVGDSLKTYDAISKNQELETGSKIKVVGVYKEYLVVEKIKNNRKER